MSKQIDSIKWGKQAGPDGKYKINAVKDGDSVVSKEGLTAAELEEHIGKEAAEKITAGGLSGELSGLDLKIGGECMKGFYDKMMVKAANKYAKKYGAKVEVKKTTTDAPGDVVQEAGSRQWFIERDGIMDTDRTFATEALAREAMEEGQDIWTLKITPEMKRAILTEGIQASVDQNRIGGGILANALDNVTRQRGMMA